MGKIEKRSLLSSDGKEGSPTSYDTIEEDIKIDVSNADQSNLISSGSFPNYTNYTYKHQILDESDDSEVEIDYVAKKIVMRSVLESIKDFLYHKKLLIVGMMLSAVLFTILGTQVWTSFGYKAWMTIIVVYFTFLVLIVGNWSPEIVMLGNTTVLLALGLIDVPAALQGFSNSGVFIVAVLFIVASGIQETGSLEYLVQYILRSPSSLWKAQVRLLYPVAFLSGFINNTPLVAMLIPVVINWSRKIKIPASKLLIPLSYATILGGTCTIVGTSTNLIVVSFLKKERPDISLNIFEIGLVGAPLAIIGVTYIVIFSKWLLPDRSSGVMDLLKVERDFTITARISEKSSLIGKTVEYGGLNQLQGLSLIEVERIDGSIVERVASDTEIKGNDTLTFIGKMNSVRELWAIPGLHIIDHLHSHVKSSQNNIITEVLVPEKSQLIGKTPGQSRFKAKYGISVISVYRDAEKGKNRLPSCVLEQGDILLMESSDTFIAHGSQNTDSDFLAIQEQRDPNEPKKQHNKFRMILAPVISLVMILLNATELVSLVTASLCAVFVMLITGCITIQGMKKSINMDVVVTIASSFGMANAMETSGVAEEVSKNLVSVFSNTGDIGLLFSIYLCTAMLTAFLSNTSSVALMFPIVYRINELSLKSRMYLLMFSASADFCTSFGYITNMMVWTAGGYKFTDFTKFGFPLQITLGFFGVFLN
eukprot:TRINITY_DN8723_c0_g2_i1.p1 TRINITY_DN8723_c0_g2~~TRINITY_DN8723_c0_g2_i1.p1  ORF type:complete len:706 (-),score=99.03 TRINITY_DN8723_c0_g2_i1:63-2180(-)